MNDKRIIISINDKRMSVLAVRRSQGEKGIALSGTYPLAGESMTSDVISRLSRFGGDVILVLPRRQVVLKYLSLPSRNPQELYRMADLQSAQGLPFSREEIIFKAAINDTGPDGHTRMIAAVARRETVEVSLKSAAASGINPGRCAVSAFGIAAWHAHRFSPKAGEIALVVDADSLGAELCFCCNRKLLFARSLSFEAAAKLSQDMIPQVQLTLDSFQREYPHTKVGKIIITGVGDYRALLKEVLTQILPVEIEEVSSSCRVQTEGPAEDSATALWGLAWATDLGPDLIPSAVPDAQFARAQRLSFLRLGAAVLFAVGILASVMMLDLRRQEQTLDAVRQKVSLIKKEAKDAGRNIRFIELIKKNMNDRILVADLMQELYRIVPERTALTSIHLVDGVLTVQGQTKESSDVNVVQNAMMGSRSFKDVALQYANRPQRLALEYTEFRISCRLKDPAAEAAQ